MSDPFIQKMTLPAESLPVMAEADVIVIGGGTSGFIAATAAVRTGARTILVERFGYLGGCSTAPYNTTIARMGDSDGNRIIGGLPQEYLERMHAAGQCLYTEGHLNQIWPPYTRKVALDMVTESGVDLWLYTWASGVIQHDGVIEGLVVQTKGGRGVLLARTFVDASGDGDVAAMAGASFEMSEIDDLQQVSCDYIACGVDAARVVEWARANPDRINHAAGLEENQPMQGVQRMVSFFLKDAQADRTVHVGVAPTVKLCIYREAVRLQGNVQIDPLDPRALTYAEVEGLRGVLQHLSYLKDTIPGFENAFLVSQSHLGVRETRRIVGRYRLTLDDLLNNARFDDVVALNCRALDYHLKGTVFTYTLLKGNHDIPLRSLVPEGLSNLLVAGRCISCDHLAQASLRGAATCMATGHAAGTAAAVAAKAGENVAAMDVTRVQHALRSQSGILGTGDRASLFAT